VEPEQKARAEIDRQLAACGWLAQDHKAMNLAAGPGIAVREFPLETGPVDYLLYAGSKVIGVIEAKPEGHALKGVEIQSRKYVVGVPAHLPAWRRPPPFAYESTGAVTQFTNGLEPDARSREVFTFHRPEELVRLAGLEAQVRGRLRAMPGIEPGNLWPVQRQTVENLEKSFAKGLPRSLIQMATGSGKTHTAAAFCERLIRFGGAKRILFLVDRNTLGDQAHDEFQRYTSPHNGYRFTEEYPVQHARKNAIEPAAKVVITTIQRLYSILKGEPEYDEANEEQSMFESGRALTKEPLPVVYNKALPIETFDFIVIDECHRSIYNVWRQVLEYFDATLIGLTATPTPQTIGFFHNNVVQDYSHERAVADGVNVGYDVYRIRTKVTGGGATLEGTPGLFIPMRDRRTHKKRLQELADDLTYTAGELDRDVVAKDQIRLVMKTFHERLFTEIFPNRKEVPKTLVFAKNDLHAEDIVDALRLEFGRGNDFCVKITSKTTGAKPKDLLAKFRNDYMPRIAVTVDLIATGTDVKAIECLLFMRNIESAAYFEQMKGRGVRIISSDDLAARTPDSVGKDRFVIVDAVGVCERDKTHSKPLDRQPSVPLEKLLQMAAQGVANADLASTLGVRLARLATQADYEQNTSVAKIAGGKDLHGLAADLFGAVDPDRIVQHAAKKFGIKPPAEPTEAQLDEAERETAQAALKPFFYPKLRELIIAIKTSIEQVIDEITQDELVVAQFDAAARDKAMKTVQEFRAFVESHKADIEAIRILYSQPYRAGLRYRQVKDLAAKLSTAPFNVNPKKPESVNHLWTAHRAIEPDKVRGHARGLADLVALVRHAIKPDEPIAPVAERVEVRYAAWLADKSKAGLKFTPDQKKWLDAIKDHIAAALAIEQDDFADVPFSNMGGLGKVHQLFGERLPKLLEEMNERLAA
jgi:type I restriction enzyme R subunit